MPLSRVRRSLKRTGEELRDASIFLVATEGEKTERLYLDQFRNRRVKVVPIVCDDGHSSPSGVFDKLSEAVKAFDFGAGDSFWLVVDKDQWEEAMFADVRRRCADSGFNLLVSHHRFEAFLCLHFEDCSEDTRFESGEYEEFLREKLGSYNKNNYDAERIFQLRETGCYQAEERDDQANEIFPPEHCSRVYMLVRAIEGACLNE